jgi:hypothetical protein
LKALLGYSVQALDGNYEERLYDYYGRPVYWKTDAANASQPPVSIP